MLLSRGLAALTLIVSLFTIPAHAEFLYKDEVVNNPKFAEQINTIGAELKAKTGVSLYLVMLHDLDNNQSIVDYEKNITGELDQPSVVLTFVDLKQQIDIIARPAALYKHFNKSQVLSPNATFIGAVVSSVMFARNYDEVKEFVVNRGGTILPILGEKTKGNDTVSKYSVAMYNGYSDVAEQIAAHNGVTLSTSAGTGSKDFIDILRLIFYGTIILSLLIYLRGKYLRKKGTDNE